MFGVLFVFYKIQLKTAAVRSRISSKRHFRRSCARFFVHTAVSGTGKSLSFILPITIPRCGKMLLEAMTCKQAQRRDIASRIVWQRRTTTTASAAPAVAAAAAAGVADDPTTVNQPNDLRTAAQSRPEDKLAFYV